MTCGIILAEIAFFLSQPLKLFGSLMFGWHINVMYVVSRAPESPERCLLREFVFCFVNGEYVAQ